MEEMERLRAEEARLTEQQKYGDWVKKEEDFHLEQAKMRSKIRLIEGREKPIDVLAKNVLLFGDEADVEVGIKVGNVIFILHGTASFGLFSRIICLIPKQLIPSSQLSIKERITLICHSWKSSYGSPSNFSTGLGYPN
jgi:hypothetical protein